MQNTTEKVSAFISKTSLQLVQVWSLHLFSKLKGEDLVKLAEVAESVSHFHSFCREQGSPCLRQECLWVRDLHTRRVSVGWEGAGRPSNRKQSHLLCLQGYLRLQLGSHF